MDKLLIIDGNSILNRGFYGVSGSNLLRTKDGIYTNAIYGFLGIMQKVLKEQMPKYICASFDLKAPTFRHKQYAEYKANRKGMPYELEMQMSYMKEILRLMNIFIIEKEGYEADDIVGTIAKQMKNELDVKILTGDRDSFQLVEDNINILLPHTVRGQTTMEIITPEVIKEKYGLEPIQMIQVKALMGDPSDNIPGVPGIGEKTALSLIKKYNSVDEIYSFIENNPEQKEIKGKQLENIKNNRPLAILSKELGTIMINVPIEYTKKDLLQKNYNDAELYELLKRLELRTYIGKFELGEITETTNEIDLGNIVEIYEDEKLDELISLIKDKKEFVYYFSDNDRYTFEDINELIIYLDNVTYSMNKEYMTLDKFKKYFKDIFENKDIHKIGYDTKRDYIFLYGIDIHFEDIFFDILIADYLVESTRTKFYLKDMIKQYSGIVLKKDEKTTNSEQISFDLGFNQEAVNKVDNRREIVKGIYLSYIELKNKLEFTKQLELFNNIEMRLVAVLGNMEVVGIQVDESVLDELGKDVDKKVIQLQKDIYELAGEEFNISSPKQLGEILFEKLKLQVIKKNKTGYSTDVDVLESLENAHPIIPKLLEYRKYVKLKTTYIDGIRPYILNNRIHTKLLQTSTATGRLSSIEPNLQNIPVRTEYGKNLRKLFVSKDNCVLLDADYSQIELRVLSHIANDEVMLQAFKDNVDIHTLTAMQVFDLKKDEVKPEDRQPAKAVNFGIVYGISDYGLAKNIGKGVKEAKIYIDKYFDTYKGIKEYMSDIITFAKENEYVDTMFGHRRYIPEINSSNYIQRQFGERVAMNTAIQGTAADIIKIAMINIYNKLKEESLKSKLVLQIHDELIIETYEEEVEKVKIILKEGMEEAVSLKIPLNVEVEQGKNWFEAK
ncbi:MAG: DNA polymerase I [Bacilli bacterium]